MTVVNKIAEFKKRANPITYGSLSVAESGNLENRVSSLDERVVEGYAVIWGKPNLHGEKFIRGAFSKSINDRGPGSGATYEIKFFFGHDRSEPLSLFATLTEDETGLYFKTKPLDNVVKADETLIKLRSGTLNNFSIGFNYNWEMVEWDSVDDTLVVKEAYLYEISVVAIPSDLNTFCIREGETLESETETLIEQTETLIKQLPRKFQIEVREIIARHKSLSVFVPPIETAHEERAEPVEAGLDYDVLLTSKIF